MSAIVWKHINKKINSVISGKCYPFSTPEITRVKEPHVSFNISGAVPLDSKDGQTLDTVQLVVNCYDLNYEHMITNAEKIRTGLEDYAGTSEGTEIKHTRCTGWLIPEIERIPKADTVYECTYFYEIRLVL